MTTQGDRLETSINGMAGELRALTKTLATNVALCEACRQVVLGNGGKPIDRRVTELETIRAVSISQIVITCLVVGTLSSAIGAIVAVTCS